MAPLPTAYFPLYEAFLMAKRFVQIRKDVTFATFYCPLCRAFFTRSLNKIKVTEKNIATGYCPLYRAFNTTILSILFLLLYHVFRQITTLPTKKKP